MILKRPCALGSSPLYLAFGMSDEPGARLPAPSPLPFPALPDAVTLGRHERLAGEFSGFLACGDGRAVGDWLRRLAREPAVNPWLLIDQLTASVSVQAPARATFSSAALAGSTSRSPEGRRPKAIRTT
jgi:hypothetical protein